MKHLIIAFILMLSGCSVYSQTMPSNDIKVNYHVVNKTSSQVQPAIPLPHGQSYNLDIKIPKTEQDCLKNAIPTSNTAQYKQANHAVYATQKGKLFIVVPNKEGTGYYRKYIPQQ